MSDNRLQAIPRRTFLRVSAALGATAVLGGCAAPSDVSAPDDDAAAPASEDVAPGLSNPEASIPYEGVFPNHEPYGEGIGACPGRVVWEHDAATVAWDGEGYWWRTENFDEEAVRRLVDDAIAVLGGREPAAAGWQELFHAHNERSGGSGGYRPGQTVAVKANINGSGVFGDDDTGETQLSYTNPVLLRALVASMVEEANIDAGDIVVYDASRLFPRPMVEYVRQGDLADVRFVGRDTAVADESAPIWWSHEFSGSTCFLPTCVTDADYLVNLANLKGHSYGMTLCGKNHFGSFLNGNALRPPEGANLHQFVSNGSMEAYSPLVDFMVSEHLGGKTVLYLLDALICAPSEGANVTGENARWQQEPFGGHCTASIFASQDPVAIDSVGADFLMNEPAVTERNGALRDNPNVENYLHEAALAVAGSPSGTVYGAAAGVSPANLGVHEHWNNAVEKLYGRNLGNPEGIELVAREFGAVG